MSLLCSLIAFTASLVIESAAFGFLGVFVVAFYFMHRWQFDGSLASCMGVFTCSVFLLAAGYFTGQVLTAAAGVVLAAIVLLLWQRSSRLATPNHDLDTSIKIEVPRNASYLERRLR